jgi:hypothetical protein
MLGFLIAKLLLIISLITHTNVSYDTPATQNYENKGELISALYGRWEGDIEYQYFESAVFNKKYTKPFGIEIAPTTITFYNKDDAGKWIKIGEKFTNSFKYELEKNTIAGYFFESGGDEDGIWVESQTMYITFKDSHTILLYSTRSVSNTDDSAADAKWMQMGVGELQKK